jgi:TonB-linked SusC/RagA family outer membrane protein
MKKKWKKLNGSPRVGCTKILRIMKLLMLFLWVSLFQLSATAFSQGVKLNFKSDNASVGRIIQEIERQTNFAINYSASFVDVQREVDVNFSNAEIAEVLQVVFANTNVGYQIQDSQILLFDKKVQLQQKTLVVTGTIVDTNQDPMPGVTVAIKGTSTGSITDMNGQYILSEVPDNATLVYSFIGMKTVEIAVAGREKIDVVLESDVISVDEVVVTALGISREKKALGYAVQDVKGEQVTQSKELNVVNALAGKVAGVHITQGGGGLGGGGARIVIRGETSLAGNNAPMTVVDGIPAGINDVAPEDIESISVLKGPAAAALYGSRAGSGVILITTKKGPMNGRLNVEVNSSMSFQNPFVLPDVQDQYGQGTGGEYVNNRDRSWGPKFENQSVEQLWGSDVWKSHPDNARDFYDTGSIITNNVSLAGNNETGTFRLSYTNVLQKGMVPNTKYDENRIDLTSGWTYLDGLLDVNANVKYAVITNDNNQSMDPRLWPTNLDLDVLQDYWLEEGVEQRQWMFGSNNPYFLLHENTNWSRANKYHGNLSLTFNFTQSLSLLLRTGVNGDFNETRNQSQVTTEGSNSQYGSFSTGFSKGYEMNSDFLLKYDKKLSSSFSMVASVGGNMMASDGSWLSGGTSQLYVPNLYNLSNTRVAPSASNANNLHTKNNALYAFLNLGYKDMIYLDLTGRNDWTSTLLYKVNDSYFYPSASLSVLLNKMVNMGDQVDLLKLKANYAGVGKSIGRFQLDPNYYFRTGNGKITMEESGTKSYRNLKPEYSYSFELGAEGTFFKNRLNLDFTYYNIRTINQLWSMLVTDVAGYNSVIRNIGEVTSNGLEITLNAVPVKVGKFQWNTSINWSMDRTEVTELDPELLDHAILKELDYRLYTYDKVGERKGAIYSKAARRFEYDPEVHDASLAKYNGQLFYDTQKDLPRGDLQIIGHYNPDWIGSWYNEFRWGNFNASALLFANVGNSVFNSMEQKLVEAGLDKRTVAGRETGVLPDGVWESPEGIRPFAPGDEINAESYWGDYMTDSELHDIWVEDGSFLKLKEVNLGYTLPNKLLTKTPLKNVRLSVTGRNLALWTKVKHVDPETFTSGNNGAGLIPGVTKPGGIPSARTYSLNLNIQF